MADMQYLLSVRELPEGGYEASVRSTLVQGQRARVGAQILGEGQGSTEGAAVIAAFCQARIGQVKS